MALALLVLLSSGHRVFNDFVYDDVQVIEEGTVIHDPSRLLEVWSHHTMFASSHDPGEQPVDTYRPVPITLFMVDAAISGRSPVGYHVTNLALHAICVMLVFQLALSFLGGGAWGPALYGAAVFAVHPWAAEAHLWINGRSDPLCLAFGLGAFVLLLRAERQGHHPRKRASLRAVGAVLLLLGLLSKETLVMVFPAILLAPVAHGEPTTRRVRWLGRGVPLALAATGYVALRLAVLGGVRAARDGSMLAEAAHHLPWLLADSLYRSLAPGIPYLRSLRDEYAQVGAVQLSLASALFVCVLAGAWLARKRAPLAGWSVLWFFPPLLPIAIISTILWPGFGRYLYVPAAGLAWALAAIGQLVSTRFERRALPTLFAAVHVLTLAGVTALFTRDFASDERLYGAAIAARPDIAMGYGWLGLARRHAGDEAGAVSPLLRATELDPSTHRYLLHAGRALLLSGERGRAQEVARRGIERFRDRPEEAPYHLLAVNSMSRRDPERAVGHLVRCLELWPGRSDCSAALDQLRRDPTHEAELERLLERRPDLRAALGRAE